MVLCVAESGGGKMAGCAVVTFWPCSKLMSWAQFVLLFSVSVFCCCNLLSFQFQFSVAVTCWIWWVSFQFQFSVAVTC